MQHLHDGAIRTHYAEFRERARAAGQLLPGTPGSVVTHRVKGGSYLSRAYYVASSQRIEDFIGPAENEDLRNAVAERMQFSEWIQRRVGRLKKLGFQVADRETARVLVVLHNSGAFQAGLVLVGTLAYMARLNDLGISAFSSRTRGIDAARESRVKLAIQLEFLSALKATTLPFVEVPGLSPRPPPFTSARLPGAGELRIDVLTSGTSLGAPVVIPELFRHAQAIPGRSRRGEPEKAKKDYQQAVTLAAALGSDGSTELKAAFKAASSGTRCLRWRKSCRRCAGSTRATRQLTVLKDSAENIGIANNRLLSAA
jgi:hypothetical protein